MVYVWYDMYGISLDMIPYISNNVDIPCISKDIPCIFIKYIHGISMHIRQVVEMSDKRFAGITIIDYCRGLFSNLRQSGGSREL